MISEKKHLLNRTSLRTACLIAVLASCGYGSQDNLSGNRETDTAILQGSDAESGNGDLSIEAAGQKYLDIVNNVNCAFKAVVNLQNANALGDGTVDLAALPDLQRAFRVLSSEREAAVRSLVGTTWPEIVAADIETLAREWSLGARAELAISEAVDGATYTLEMNRYNDLTSSPKSNPGYIRSVLGIGPASETDQC